MEENKDKKTVRQKVGELFALVFGKRKPSGIWFNLGKSKVKRLPTKEEVAELLDIYAPALIERLKKENIGPSEDLGDDRFSTFVGQKNKEAASYLYDWITLSNNFRGNSVAGGGISVNSWGAFADADGEGNPLEMDIANAPANPNWGKTEKPPQRIAKKPVEVRAELEMQPVPWNMDNLDEKIKLLEDKNKLVNQSYSNAELQGLIERLNNRKQYLQHKDFFEQFPNTTDEKIDQLLSKYLLIMKSSDIFVPEFPKEAIDVMTKYTDIVGKICDKKPVFYVIAEEKDFQKKFERRDPILLVQSPFGFYYQILGAWDKEMMLLSEL
jgi:hypothetical protein